jgi:hypothetical protein
VPDRWPVRRPLVRVGSIEPMLQDGFDRAVAGRADIIAALAGGLDAHRAIAAREPQNAETSAEALLGVAFMIASTRAIVAGPILAASRLILAGVHSA